MDFRKTIARLLPAVARAIRHHYPEDFGYRCFQTSVATAILLEEAGFRARVVAGDVEIATRNLSTGELERHGFSHETFCQSHFWCISENHVIDVTTPFLATNTPAPVLKPPLICWNLDRPLIPKLRYVVRDPRPEIVNHIGPEDSIGISEVVKDAGKRMASKNGVGPHRPIIFGPNTLRENAVKRDPWCAWVVASSAPLSKVSVMPGRPAKHAAPRQRLVLPVALASRNG